MNGRSLLGMATSAVFPRNRKVSSSNITTSCDLVEVATRSILTEHRVHALVVHIVHTKLK